MNGAAPVTAYYVRAFACALHCCICDAKKESESTSSSAAIACQLLQYLKLVYMYMCVQ